jgi:6-pyruvoyl-tetrahydropterin synthase
VFHAQLLDENYFVLDVGKIPFIKEYLEDTFDHTLLLNEDDPMLDYLKGLEADTTSAATRPSLAKIVVVENCGMEALARSVFMMVQDLLRVHMADDVMRRKLRVCSVTCWEDSKNRSTWSEIPAVQYQ